MTEQEERAEKEEPILAFFEGNHLPADLQNVSLPFCELAYRMAMELPRNSERSETLRKLLEARDAAVRAAVFEYL